MPKTPKPNPVGRPRLPKKEAKGETLRIRATSEELKAFDRAAKSAGQTRSEWIRGILQDAITVKPVATFQTEIR